jgi:hypothetical protein
MTERIIYVNGVTSIFPENYQDLTSKDIDEIEELQMENLRKLLEVEKQKLPVVAKDLVNPYSEIK